MIDLEKLKADREARVKTGWGFDYIDQEVVDRQNKTPNATTDIDGIFYDMQNAVHLINTLEADYIELRKLADELAFRLDEAVGKEKLRGSDDGYANAIDDVLSAHRKATSNE